MYQNLIVSKLGDIPSPTSITKRKGENRPKTWFQLMVPVPNHNVTKNLTDHRMHVDGPQISEINPKNDSFQKIGTNTYLFSSERSVNNGIASE